MRADALIPSKYLSAADLQGGEFVMTIARIAFDKIDDKEKPILYFVGAQKGLALNKTNINNIVQLYGGETDNWTGKQVTLFEAMVDFQGRSTPAIRIKGVAPARPDPISSGLGQQQAHQRAIGGISDNLPPAGHPINDPPF